MYFQRVLPIYYETEAPITDDIMTVADVSDEENSNEKVIVKTIKPGNQDENNVFKTNEEVNEITKVITELVVSPIKIVNLHWYVDSSRRENIYPKHITYSTTHSALEYQIKYAHCRIHNGNRCE